MSGNLCRCGCYQRIHDGGSSCSGRSMIMLHFIEEQREGARKTARHPANSAIIENVSRAAFSAVPLTSSGFVLAVKACAGARARSR